ncbi:MAG: 16S rRNA (adenine(1518)-N(6)/adenine(1519)-N(6))-dimethyltransferase RsmA [Patescibacteria group bacterium]|jgi:16S rRNA (adenine1518-N6/adenine1519-N6)-dimethyltransferase
MSDLLTKTRDICRLLEIKPARSKGQNFLINEKIYEDIIEAADIKKSDTVLEIGPGLGFLTTKLAAQAKRVIAVELDDKLAAYLQTGVAASDRENIKIINEDILKFNPAAHLAAGEKYQVVANLPYNITSIFLRQFLSAVRPPESLVLMLQKEVAERIVAVPPDMSLLAVSVQYYGAPKIIREVKAGNFWPEPAVSSAIIRIDLSGEAGRREEDKRFFRLVKFGFSAKRKMLKNNLAAGLKIAPKIIEEYLVKQGLDPKIRAEELSLDDWKKLFAALAAFVI